jgi:hypothetical protein
VDDIFQSDDVGVRKGIGINIIGVEDIIIIIIVEGISAGIDDGIVVSIIIGVVIIIIVVVIIIIVIPVVVIIISIPIRATLADGGVVDGIFDIMSSISPTAVGIRPDVWCRSGWMSIQSDVRCRWG